jgi:iron transport multicopper oxidase
MIAKLYSRFTTRGIVALVFSCITGALGVIVVGFYGAKPVAGNIGAPSTGVIHVVKEDEARKGHGVETVGENGGSSNGNKGS